MRDKVVWVPFKLVAIEGGGTDRVYVKHYVVPFAGRMLASDTAFSVPAFRMVKGKRQHGYITPADGTAFTQEHGHIEFRVFKGEK